MLDGITSLFLWAVTVVWVAFLWRIGRRLRPILRHVFRGLLCAILLAPAPSTLVPKWLLPTWTTYLFAVDGSAWITALGIYDTRIDDMRLDTRLIGVEETVIFVIAFIASRTRTGHDTKL